MREKRRGVSAGTILALLLTAAVVAGCVFVFAKIQQGNPKARMSAQRVFGLVGDALQGTTPVPVPQATVRTVTVTLAPAPTAAATAARPTEAPVKKKSYSFTITVGGLLKFEKEISDTAYNKNKKTFQYGGILSPLRAKVKSDLNLVTLGQVINTEDQKYDNTLVPAAALDAIRESGFDFVMLNTSHVLDHGIQGVNNTVNALAKRNFACGGVNAGSASQNTMLTLKGVKVALLSYSDKLTNKGSIAWEQQPDVMALYSIKQAQKDIAAARKQGARFVIVNLFWAKKDTASVTATMRATATALAEAGADLILGYQPNRVLPVENVSVSDDEGFQRQCLIAYSMGTLVGESRDGYDISGMLLHLKVTCEDDSVDFDTVEFTPTYIWRQTVSKKLQYQVVCSNASAPKGMDNKQKEYMSNALKRIRNTLKDSYVEERK